MKQRQCKIHRRWWAHSEIMAKISHQIWATPTTITWIFRIWNSMWIQCFVSFFFCSLSQKTASSLHCLSVLSKYLAFFRFFSSFVECFFCYLNSYTFIMDNKERFHAQFTLHMHFYVTVFFCLLCIDFGIFGISSSSQAQRNEYNLQKKRAHIMLVNTS